MLLVLQKIMFVVRPKIDGVTLLSSWRLLVKRLGQKYPSYCLVNRQEIVLFSWRSQYFFANYTVLRSKSPNIGNFIRKLRSSDGEFSAFSFRLWNSDKSDYFSRIVSGIVLFIDGIYTLFRVAIDTHVTMLRVYILGEFSRCP